MKIPETPKDKWQILNEKRKSVAELLKNQPLIDLASRYNKQYVHWEELKYKSVPENVDRELLWALMKIRRETQQRTINLGTIELKYSLFDDALRKLHFFDKNAGGQLNAAFKFVNTEGKGQYIINSLMEEAIASSQLEGANTTRKKAKEMLRKKIAPSNYSERMIANNYNTIQKIVQEWKTKPLTPEIIIGIQKSITENTLESKEDEGIFRRTNDVVVADNMDPGVIYHIHPNYTEVPGLITKLCEFANDDNGDFVHPVVKAIILHFLIGYIHPFNDGNGRTARSIFYWYILSRGYWLFELMAISRILLRSRVKYGLAYLYSETDDNDITYFINYNLQAIDEAFADLEKYARKKQKEQEDILKTVKNLKGVNIRQADVLKEFIKNPDKIFTIEEIMNTYGVVYQTARTDLLYLEKNNYIEKMNLNRKKFGFRLLSPELKGNISTANHAA
ncbi:MAG TPA: Fic family protein [archaeon]|nr:Fic family protein [archaeon]